MQQNNFPELCHGAEDDGEEMIMMMVWKVARNEKIKEPSFRKLCVNGELLVWLHEIESKVSLEQGSDLGLSF